MDEHAAAVPTAAVPTAAVPAEPVQTTVEIELDADTEAAWHAVATPDGLAGWLAPEVDLATVAPGAAGRVVDDDGVARRLCVREVADRHHVTFTWWREDDPQDASTVTLLVLPAVGVTRVRVVESTAFAAPRACAALALVRA